MTVTPDFEPADATVIDDLTFADLLRIALEAAPGASQGRWTVHGPVDPGVTVIELYAWQFEQRLFMAEQVTDPVVRASLRLLGLAEPASTRVARTVLCLRSASAPAEVPSGTLMDLYADPVGRGFTLDAPVAVLPVGEIEIAGRLLSEGDVLELRHRYRGPALDGQPVSLLAVVAAASGVPPAWSPDAVDVAPPADLAWTAVGPDGRETAVPVQDTTGGFRRSGLLRFSWPQVWNSLGADPCRLRARVVAGRYTEDAPLRGVHPNAAIASHCLRVQLGVAEQIQALEPLPGQRLVLPGTAGMLLDGPGEVSLSVTELDGVEHEWVSAADWTWIGPGERVMVVDRTRGEVTFGDGRVGRILRPKPGAPATMAYGVGGGELGNIGADSRWVREAGVETATNPVPAEGGAAGEVLDAATQRAAGELTRADRVVTTQDARDLALATPGVGVERAHATAGLHPDFPCEYVPTAVSVTVVPYADREGPAESWTRAPVPDKGALAAVAAQLRHGRLVGQEVFALAPVYRRVKVWLSVSQSSQGKLLDARIKDALQRYLDPLRGGPDGDGWPFGGPVRPSGLIGIVRGALGPEAQVGSLSAALDDGEATDCRDLVIGSRELVCLEDAAVTFTTVVPSGSGLS